MVFSHFGRILMAEDCIANQLTAETEWEPSPIRGISRNVFLLSGVSLLTDISSEMVYPLVPIFLSSVLGAPVSVIGIIEGFAEATASIFKWFFGALSDRMGKRKPFCLAGYGLAAVTKALLAAATVWPVVLAARVLDRFGKGLRGSPRDALIADSTPRELHGRAFGFHRSGDSIGAVCGPLLAILLMGYFADNYRAVFLIACIPGLVSTLLILAVREHFTIPSPRPLLSFGVARANPGLRRFLLITLVFALGNSSDMFLILRARQLGADGTTVVALYALCNFFNVVSSYPAGIVSDRAGRRRVLACGFFLFGLIYLAFALVTGLTALWVLFAAYGVYLGLTDGVSKALVVDLVSKEDRGSALGLHAAITGISALPASVVAGALWQQIGAGAALGYGAVAGFFAACLMLYVGFKPVARAT
jgi:MFS family permease